MLQIFSFNSTTRKFEFQKIRRFQILIIFSGLIKGVFTLSYDVISTQNAMYQDNRHAYWVKIYPPRTVAVHVLLTFVDIRCWSTNVLSFIYVDWGGNRFASNSFLDASAVMFYYYTRWRLLGVSRHFDIISSGARSPFTSVSVYHVTYVSRFYGPFSAADLYIFLPFLRN